MSHHLDSPLARQDSRLDLTDLYLFPGEQGLTLIMTMNTSAYADKRRPGFHPEGRYEFKVHLDQSPYETFTYRFVFGETQADGRQPVRAFQLLDDQARRDDTDGTLIAEGSTGAPVDGDNGLRVFAGEVADPFYFDLRLLGAMHDAVDHGIRADLTDWLAGPAENSFATGNVAAIVLEFPADGPFPRHQHIGAWATAKLATDDGGWRQVNRAAIPMMWPIFRNPDTEYASDMNEVHPAQDAAVDGKRIAELAAGAAAAYGTADADAYGEVLAGRLLPDLLPYHVGTPAGLTFAGFNGRLLADNAVEVMYSLVTNTAFSSRLSPAQAAASRQELFPYVVPARP